MPVCFLGGWHHFHFQVTDSLALLTGFILIHQ
jgi:hypothetical protein